MILTAFSLYGIIQTDACSHANAKRKDCEMKRYYPLSIRPLIAWSAILCAAMVVGIVLLCTNEYQTELGFVLLLFGAVLGIACAGILLSDVCSYILMGEEAVRLPKNQELRYSDIRSITIHYIEAKKPNILGMVAATFLSILFLDDCGFSASLGTKGKYECTFHKKSNDDVVVSLYKYGEERAEEILTLVASRIHQSAPAI